MTPSDQTFQRDVKRTLLRYTFGPVLLLVALFFALVGASWSYYVVMRSDEVRHLAAEVLDETIADYSARADLAASQNYDPDILRTNASARAAVFQYLYHEVNIDKRGTQFFLLDRKKQLVLGSEKALPPALTDVPEGWGVLARFEAHPETVHAEFLRRAADESSSQDLVIGRSLPHGNGYFLFLIPQESLQRSIRSPYLDFVLTDSYGGTPLATGSSYHPAAGHPQTEKLSADIASANRQTVSYGKGLYFVTEEALQEVPWTLYSILPVTDLIGRYRLGALILASLLLLLLPVLYHSVRQESLARAHAVKEEEQRATAMAEIRRLESQFQPHFLFNTLENIRYMVCLDPQAASRMLLALSGLLRYSIRGTSRLVPLAEDLTYTHHYLEIQTYRFGQRLRYQEQIANELGHALIPRLLFQPLLENAIHYGESADGTLTVSLTIRPDGPNRLTVIVKDAGCGMSREQLEEIRTLLQSGDDSSAHTGLCNIARRLRLLYGKKAGMSIESPPAGGFCVTLHLPFQEESEERIHAQNHHC